METEGGEETFSKMINKVGDREVKVVDLEVDKVAVDLEDAMVKEEDKVGLMDQIYQAVKVKDKDLADKEMAPVG